MCSDHSCTVYDLIIQYLEYSAEIRACVEDFDKNDKAMEDLDRHSPAQQPRQLQLKHEKTV